MNLKEKKAENEALKKQAKEQETANPAEEPTAANKETVEDKKETIEEAMEKLSAEVAEEKAEETETVEEKNPLAEKDAIIEDLKDKHLRLSAEFDNYRKRTFKEKADIIRNGGEKVITSLLPVLDDMERALENMEKAKDVDSLLEGIQLIYQKYMKALNENGVKQVETKNNKFDTDYHEAIAMVPAPEGVEKGVIVDCVQNGYTLNEKVIRHAKVVVAQ
ncbi:MAG: nucleotide exchange factor GrpE [Bacteroidaceae bacterium]|nr:nucleotide exchange factor GrpE [Bacteroidaceae bacterium]